MITRRTHLKKGDLLLDRYRIMALLGSGGMSTVYLAEDFQANGSYYAVKESRMDPRWAHQLMVEAKMLGELDHPHLPRIAELFLSGNGDYFYIIQDYIEGLTLSKRFQQCHGKIPYVDLVDYLIQVCDVLQYLHDQNIAYKDLKPGNIMITKHRLIKLIDFGIARKYGKGQARDRVQMGTVGFAAPEQFNGGMTDHRTDLFSLGAVMYFLFSGGDYVDSGEDSMKKISAKFPGKLTKCIESLTHTDPDDRIQSADEVRAILERLRNKKLSFRQRRAFWSGAGKSKTSAE